MIHSVQKVLSTPSKHSLKFYRCLINSDSTDIQQRYNVRYKSLFSGKSSATETTEEKLNANMKNIFCNRRLIENFSTNNVRKVQYFMRKAFHWQHWTRSKNNNEDDRWYNKKRVLIGATITGAFALIIAQQALNSRKKTKPVNDDESKVNVERFPSNSDEIPEEIQYLIIGGGAAGFSASRSIKARDSLAKVLIITKDKVYPYMKPPLSKELFYNVDREMSNNLKFVQWSGAVRSIFFEIDEYYTDCPELINSEMGGISVARGWNITSLNPIKKIAVLEDGKTIKYEKCLIATGSVPVKHPVLENQPLNIKEKIIYFNNLNDYKTLDEAIEAGAKTITVFGGDVLSCELANALTVRGKGKLKVIQIVPESYFMGHTLPHYLADYVKSEMQEIGINVITDADLKKLARNNDGSILITLSNEDTISADCIVACIGTKANTHLAEESLLETDSILGGYVVNSQLAIDKNLYAAGDCASYYDKSSSRRKNLHWYDHAVTSGKIAGANMTGEDKPLMHQAMRWAEFGPDTGFEAVGVIDTSLQITGIFTQDENVKKTKSNQMLYKRGVLFYHDKSKIVGILLWNLYDRIPIARQVLALGQPPSKIQELVKHFNIYKE